MISKELFVASIDAIKRQSEADEKRTEAFQVILNEDSVVIGYDTTILSTQLITVLETLMCDDGDWINYFLWELDFGKTYTITTAEYADGSPIDLSTSEKLYEFLLKEKKLKKK